MANRSSLTREITDRIAEILIETMQRAPLDFLDNSRKRDMKDLEKAAEIADCQNVLMENNRTVFISEVNLSLERYKEKNKATHKPSYPEIRGGRYRLPENKFYH